MNPVQFGAFLILTSGFACVLATVGGSQYSINVHFVPPMVSGACQTLQFWNPPNVTCALCFCMTGTLSRCIPQPGCNPNNATSTTTTTASSTTDAGGSTTLPTTQTGANQQPGTTQEHVTGSQSTAPPEVTTISNFV